MTTMFAMTTKGDTGFEMTTVDRPQPGPSDVLIEVSAAGINPADWKSRDMPPPGPNAAPDTSAPAILGWDIAGTVVEVGIGVSRFKVGDRVFGMPCFPAPANAYAQYAVARSREIALVPDGVSLVEAGALPLAGLTAWQTLVDTLQVSDGDRVLIHAASGGVGHLAVQIAKARGAEVWGTASARNHEQLSELGADHLVDYRSERFEDVVSDMDAVLDLVGDGETSTRSLAVLKAGGMLAAISPMLPSAADLDAADVTAQFVLVEPDYASLESLAALMAAGKLRVVIGDQRPMAEMEQLHEIGKRGGPFGKLVATNHTEASL